MNLPVPTKNNNKVKLGPLPVLPSLIEELIPKSLPTLPFRPGPLGIVEGFLHNWALRQQKTAAERQADIGEAKLRQSRALYQQLNDLILFGPRLQLESQKINHEQAMLTLAQQTAEANLATIQLKNFQLQIEAQRAQLELQQMQKELGNGSDNEDGE